VRILGSVCHPKANSLVRNPFKPKKINAKENETKEGNDAQSVRFTLCYGVHHAEDSGEFLTILTICIAILISISGRLTVIQKGKAIPVTGREGPYSCETSRPSHFLDNRLTDDGEVVSLIRRPPFIPRKIPGTHLC
jgi:hypothetical protein